MERSEQPARRSTQRRRRERRAPLGSGASRATPRTPGRRRCPGTPRAAQAARSRPIAGRRRTAVRAGALAMSRRSLRLGERRVHARLGSALPCSEGLDARPPGSAPWRHETSSGNGHHGVRGDADRLRGEHDRGHVLARRVHRRRALRQRRPCRAGGRGAPDLRPGRSRPQRGLGGPASRPLLEPGPSRRGPRSARRPGSAGSTAQAPDHAHRRDRRRPDARAHRVRAGLRAGQRHHPLRRARRRTLRPRRQRGPCLRGARAQPHRSDRALRARSRAQARRSRPRCSRRGTPRSRSRSRGCRRRCAAPPRPTRA